MEFQGSSIPTRVEDLRAQSQLDGIEIYSGPLESPARNAMKARPGGLKSWAGGSESDGPFGRVMPCLKHFSHVSRSSWTCNTEPLSVIAAEHLSARKSHFAGPPPPELAAT